MEIKPIYDPYMEEEKKEVKKPDPKKKGVVEEVVEEPALPDYTFL